MAAREFKAKLAPSSGPHSFAASSKYAVGQPPGPLVVQGLFTRHPVIVVAAAVQLLLGLFAPADLALVPPAVLVGGYGVATLLHCLAPASPSNPYTQHVIPGRASAQLPSPGGSSGPDAAQRGLVVFNLGVQWNHPLGPLCPGGVEIGRRFLAMNADLMRRRDELGLISISEWSGAGVGNASSSVITYYFRDVESIHRFAHEELHRNTWDWYNLHKPAHIGIFHETFIVPARSHETIYANCVPVGLGRGAVRCHDIKGEAQWVNSLVSADTPALKTQMFRLHRDARGNPKE